MGRSLLIDPNALCASLEEIFGEIESKTGNALNGAVKEGASVAAKEWRKGAPVLHGNYKKTIRYKVDKTGGEPQATVYSTMPGLPHLLEKGHARIGGGRTSAIEHVAPAADAGFEAAEKAFDTSLAKELR